MRNFKFRPLYNSLKWIVQDIYIYYAYPWICITQNKKVCDELILLISQAYLDCDFFVINVIHCVCKTKIIINSI